MRKTKMTILATLLLVLLTFLTSCASDQGTYKSALKLFDDGKYTEAAEKFESLGSYEDASQMAMYVKATAAGESGDFETAFSTFALLGSFKDSTLMLSYYEAKQLEDTANNGIVINWKNWLSAAEKFEAIALFRDSKERAEACRKAMYDCAIEFGDSGRYETAISMFQALGSYSDSSKRERYYDAHLTDSNGDYLGASEKFLVLGDYLDSRDQAVAVLQRVYDRASEMEAAGDQDSASQIFVSLGDFSDSVERAYKPYYEKALQLEESGNWDEAVLFFRMAGEYEDASQRIVNHYRELADEYLEIEDYHQAVYALYSAGDEESLKLAYDIRYNKLFYDKFAAGKDLSESANCVTKEGITYTYEPWGPDYIAKGAYDSNGWENVYAISKFDDLIIGLCSDGTAVAKNHGLIIKDYGETDVQSGDWKNLISVVAGSNFCVGLKASGELVGTGYTAYGSLEFNDWPHDVVEISAGESQLVALRSDGTVLTTGKNSDYYEYNLGEVEQWKGIVSIAAGTRRTMGLKSDGTVIVTSYSNDKPDSLSRYKNWKDVVVITAGWNDAFYGVTKDGRVLGSSSETVNQWTDIVNLYAGNNIIVGIKRDGSLVFDLSPYFIGNVDNLNTCLHILDWKVDLTKKSVDSTLGL